MGGRELAAGPRGRGLAGTAEGRVRRGDPLSIPHLHVSPLFFPPKPWGRPRPGGVDGDGDGDGAEAAARSRPSSLGEARPAPARLCGQHGGAGSALGAVRGGRGVAGRRWAACLPCAGGGAAGAMWGCELCSARCVLFFLPSIFPFSPVLFILWPVCFCCEVTRRWSPRAQRSLRAAGSSVPHA